MDARARRLAKRRKFLRDIGGIVLGVLIALTLGAIATEIGWLIDVHNAKQAIAEELGEILGQGRERVRLHACVERKLTDISAILDGATNPDGCRRSATSAIPRGGRGRTMSGTARSDRTRPATSTAIRSTIFPASTNS